MFFFSETHVSPLKFSQLNYTVQSIFYVLCGNFCPLRFNFILGRVKALTLNGSYEKKVDWFQ